MSSELIVALIVAATSLATMVVARVFDERARRADRTSDEGRQTRALLLEHSVRRLEDRRDLFAEVNHKTERFGQALLDQEKYGDNDGGVAESHKTEILRALARVELLAGKDLFGAVQNWIKAADEKPALDDPKAAKQRTAKLVAADVRLVNAMRKEIADLEARIDDLIREKPQT